MRILPRNPGQAYLGAWLEVPKTHINTDAIKSALTFPVRSKKEEERFLELYQEAAHHLLVPRAFWDPAKLPCEVVDCRPRSYERVSIQSRVVLDAKYPHKTVQRDAVRALQQSHGGILQLACGLGKTVVSLHFGSILRVPMLIVVPDTSLLRQWAAEIQRHLLLPPESVGLIQGEILNWKKPVVLSTYATMASRADEMSEEVRRWFGYIILDEGHHVSAPTYAKAASFCYGYRLVLTATPERSDGTHVVYENHVGSVIYKNMHHDLIPEIRFVHTGLTIDTGDPDKVALITDVTGELHYGKLANYYGMWPARLQFILNQVRTQLAEGRKVLVLSQSVQELVNLLACWNGHQTEKGYYSSVPYPTTRELGLEGEPLYLDGFTRKERQKEFAQYTEQLHDTGLSAFHRVQLEKGLAQVTLELKRDAVGQQLKKTYAHRQKTYREELLSRTSNAGLMIFKVSPKERERMLLTKDVMFANMKYGKEGLDKKSLATVIVAEPVGEEGPLAQIMGRTQRRDDDKPPPRVILLEDDLPIIRNMCTKLRRFLRNWPADQDGPLHYTVYGPNGEET